jgi:Tfp pilus assembly protein PilE
MIVVAVLSILAMLAIPAYRGYISTARQTAAQANIEPLRLAIEDYRLDNMNTGYTGLDGVWDPDGTKTLENGNLGWAPDGDQGEFYYQVSGANTDSYTITVIPIGHNDDNATYTK